METNNSAGKLTSAALLARQLKRAREAAGITQRGLGEKIRYPGSYIADVESRRKLPSEALAAALDEFFEPLITFAELLVSAREPSAQDYGQDLIKREREAARLQVFTSSLVPGLLQTEEYARELFRVSLPWDSEQKNEARVATRIQRQSILEQEEPPLHWAIMDEAALRRPVGSAACMSAQLRHLLTISGRWGMRVQVLPFAQGGHSMMGGSLNLLTMKNGTMFGYVESFKTGELVESPERILELVELFDVARAMALPERESLDLIHRCMEEYENE